MASERERYHNPDRPPGYQNKDSEVAQLNEFESRFNPDAPLGLYKFEGIDKDKVYFPQFDIVFDLSIFNEVSEDNLSDFIIQTSDEESSSSGVSVVDSHSETTEVHQKKEKKSSSSGVNVVDSHSETTEVHQKKEKYDNVQEMSAEEQPIFKEPDHLFGLYSCEMCNSKMNSEATYIAHINGKRHLKAAKARNVVDTEIKSFPQREGESKYPRPAPGVYRKLMKHEDSLIKRRLKEELITPCPGLYKVIEIQGIAETTFYCTLCDSPCSANNLIPHLNGYKHQLKCLKHFYPHIYEDFSYQPKYKIEKEVLSLLKSVEKKEGRGKFIIVKDCHGTPSKEDEIVPSLQYLLKVYAGNKEAYSRSDRRRDIYQPSTSSDYYDHDNVLDPTKSGFYCRACHAFTNSERMWQTHVTGKRHLANLKKAPGTLPSKLKFVPVPGVPSVLEARLEGIDEPIVGLDHIRETQNNESNAETYQCLLCSSSNTHYDIIDHLLTLKHKRKYLEYIRHPHLDCIEQMNFHEDYLNALILETCAKAEAEYGRGHPNVLLPKSKLI